MTHQKSKEHRPLPPEKHRWKKGVSGNPRGRPKKQDSLTSLLRNEIKKICPADRQGRTWEELMVLATLQLAMKGNAAALKEVWERLDGKVLQAGKLQLDGTHGGEIRIKVVYDGEAESNDSPESSNVRLANAGSDSKK